MQLYQDIPRIYTAIAEWGACMTYLYLIRKEQVKSISFWLVSVAVLAGQIVFLTLTGDLSEIFWIPCMVTAVTIMYIFIMLGGGLKVLGAGYCCARAFLLAEFAASLQWQIVTFLQASGYGQFWLQIVVTIFVFGLSFGVNVRLEKNFLTQNYLQQMTAKEVMAAFMIAVAAFFFSNLSFLSNRTPFTGTIRADIFFIRTLVDFGGIAILHAYQSRICEYVTEKQLSAMNVILKNQYDQYRNYQDSVDLIQMKYHDLKHQITGLRAETDEERRKKWLDAMEEEVSAFENLNKTGNQVLDTILAAKIFHCRKNQIQITCVADGHLLEFMHVTDICSVFGNALDNAIEHVIMIPDTEKRLIHISVAARKNFVFIKIENYCVSDIVKNEEKLIASTKSDKSNHGFGLRSIKNVVEKYDGSVDVGVNNNWFELKILLPRG